MRIVLTGSSGFIGTAVTRHAHLRGWEVVPVDRTTGVDVLSDPLPEGDAVIHLAGMLGTSELFDDPHDAVRVNVNGTLTVLQHCEETGMGFVGITMPDVWQNVYQATKRCARDLASAWHRHHGLRVSHVCAYNAFGSGQKLGPVQKLIPTFADRAWRGLPLPVWGDGSQPVDLVHVDDVARMLLDATRYGDDAVFDAGTGETRSVNEVAHHIREITGSASPVEYLPMRKGEHPADVAAKGRGWDRLGWRPEFRLNDLRETVESYEPVAAHRVAS